MEPTDMPPELPDHSLVRLRARPETIYVSKGRTVLATGRRDGFLDQGPDQGLFVHRTRLLSRHRYLIDGHPPQAVSIPNVAQHSWLGYYIAPVPKAFSRHLAISDIAQQTIELRLSRYVGEGLHEDVDLANFTQENVGFTLELDLDADFADRTKPAPTAGRTDS
ncbi:glycogen debranching N-terminal domain-containing protein [Mesorhizobium cantuariense]|uniref:Glycogen debranching N-terminal domain-containing protein n=1 Tax=Mesorhizobium cantuariense TaxID=1300275 RepID=A0ABV7MP04_9HYPH